MTNINNINSFYLSEDALIKLDQIVIAHRKDTGMDSNRSAAVEHLIESAHAAAQPQKRIEPIRDGKGRVIGWAAMYGDHLVTTTDGAASEPQAQAALDAYVFEELSK